MGTSPKKLKNAKNYSTRLVRKNNNEVEMNKLGFSKRSTVRHIHFYAKNCAPKDDNKPKQLRRITQTPRFGPNTGTVETQTDNTAKISIAAQTSIPEYTKIVNYKSLVDEYITKVVGILMKIYTRNFQFEDIFDFYLVLEGCDTVVDFFEETNNKTSLIYQI